MPNISRDHHADDIKANVNAEVKAAGKAPVFVVFFRVFIYYTPEVQASINE